MIVIRTLRWSVPAIAIACAPASARAQAYPSFYPEPPPGVIEKTTGVRYATVDSLNLLMDVYRPARATAAPALILFALYWPPAQPPRVSNEWLQSWARMAAANGIVAIVPDLRAAPGTGNANAPARALGDDFQKLVAHLSAHAHNYGAHPERIALFAASGAVAAALPAVQDSRQTAIKSAVMYYGGPGANITSFRLDLPLLYVRAGLDGAGINAEISRLAALATIQNAPITLINHHFGWHGFEARNDDYATKQIMEQTLQFVKRSTEPAYQAALKAGHLDAVAAGHSTAQNYGAAAQAYAEIIRQRPADLSVRVSYGSALLANRQYDAACRELGSIAPPQYGALLPGTKACLRAGQTDAALALLRKVPADWLRFAARQLESDSLYAPLWGRSEYRALMAR